MSDSPRSVLVSAGEASGDLYASLLVRKLRERWPGTHFFGCTGPRLREEKVETALPAERLAVVGIVEVIAHLPRIYREYRKLLRVIQREKPEIAILTDSPDFHLRVARRLAKWRIPVVYLVAPQVWAWRKGRIQQIRQHVTRLLCIFPFEEAFFQSHHVPVSYIGHPLISVVHPKLSRSEFFRKHGFQVGRLLIALLPGSRQGEAARHLPTLVSAAERLSQQFPVQFVLPASANTGVAFFRERIGVSSIQVIEGEAWDAIAHADLALAASGTVTVEAAILGTPMVVFYRVNSLSWIVGKLLVRVPFYSMVNLIAQRPVVTELIQGDMTVDRLVSEAGRLLQNPDLRKKMREELAQVTAMLSDGKDAMSRAAEEVIKVRENRVG